MKVSEEDKSRFYCNLIKIGGVSSVYSGGDNKVEEKNSFFCVCEKNSKTGLREKSTLLMTYTILQ